ncbi:S4 domain-containing protein [Candidatus Accumulibacter sp. ACC003]|uniref:pseudouridine synthase n=1 Tax=Candidatus Accumulibacter sp. ACC003 TaxID=2823334 RepID=UPI0025BAD21D|nr:S4 domain-containing protein [Candidatus Accumulibacter sp. ACC003]
MPRSTLKLPRKLAASDTIDDRRSPTRRPLRGRSQLTRHATPERPASGRSDGKAGAATAPGGQTDKAQRAPRDRADTRTVPTNPTARERSAADQTTTADAPPRPTAAAASDRQAAVDKRSPRRSRDVVAGTRTGSERPQKPAKKIYPPRGIARSTGVRAALPGQQDRPGDFAANTAAADSDAPAVATPDLRQTARQAPSDGVSSDLARGLSRESPRLAKLVSQLAECSRREADEWIENGWVSVDGVVVNRLGARVNPKAKITIREAANKQPAESVTLIVNKAREETGSAPDDGRQTAAALIRADNRWHEDHHPRSFQATHLRGLATAGKLHDDEGGMLAFTQEGSVARRLSGGDSRLEMEYHVRVEGELAADGLEQLRHGLSLDKVKLQRAQVSWLSEEQMRFVLHDGKKGQIARMCELVGLQVTDIKRVRIGSVSLGKLPPGEWRYLRDDERF